MTCYAKTIAHLNLGIDSQGDLGWLYLLLSALDAAGTEGADAFPSNPPKSVLARLSSLQATHAYKRLAQLLNTAITRFDTR